MSLQMHSSRSGFLILGFLFLTALLILPVVATSSLDQPHEYPSRALQQKRQELYPNTKDPDLLDCETPLAGDLYGLGVRLGIYFNWFTAWVASNFIPDEISGALDSNSIFLLAIAISASRSLYSSELMQIDALILLELCAGTVVGVLSLWGYRTCWYKKEGTAGIRHFGGFGTHLRLLLATAVALYSVWFWTVGIQGGIAANDSADPRLSCDQVNILTLDVHGTARYIAIALGSISTVYCGTMLLASFLAAYTRAMKVIKLAKQQKWASSTRLRYSTGLNDKELNYLSNALCVFNMIWIIFAMVFVELTLNQNKVRGVLGENGKILEPAQLLPMLIGAFSFVRILFIGFELWRNPHDIAPSLGYTGSHRSLEPVQHKMSVLHLLKAFSPSLATDTSMALQKPKGSPEVPARDARDDYSKDCNVWQRLLITWLPWISLLDSWPLKQYKGLPVTEAASPIQPSGTQSMNHNNSWNDHNEHDDDDDDDDEKYNSRFEDAQETNSSEEVPLRPLDNAFTLPPVQSVDPWSPVDANMSGSGQPSLARPMVQSQAANFDRIPLETPVSPIRVRDFQQTLYDDTVATNTSYEMSSDVKHNK